MKGAGDGVCGLFGHHKRNQHGGARSLLAAMTAKATTKVELNRGRLVEPFRDDNFAAQVRDSNRHRLPGFRMALVCHRPGTFERPKAASEQVKQSATFADCPALLRMRHAVDRHFHAHA